MPYDSSYVRLFSFSEVVRDLIAGFLESPVAKTVDLDSLSQEVPPTDYPWDQRANAVVWRAQQAGAGDRSVVFMCQFEAEVDWAMAVHIAAKGSLLYRLDAEANLDEEAQMSPVLPYVLYNGGTRWTAKKNVRELVGHVPYELEPFQLSFPHEVIEERFCPLLDNASNNLAGMLFRAQRCRSVHSMLAAIEDSEDRIRLNTELELAVVDWFKDVVLPARAPEFDFSRATELGHLKETLSGHCLPTMEAAAARRHDGAVRSAFAEGMRRIVARLARDRYGAKVEEELINMISSINSGETLREIARWLRRSKNADELLEKVRKLWVPTLEADAFPGTGVQ